MQYLTPLSVPVHREQERLTSRLTITRPGLSKAAIIVATLTVIGYFIWLPDITVLYLGGMVVGLLAVFSIGGEYAWGNIAELRLRRNALRQEIAELQSGISSGFQPERRSVPRQSEAQNLHPEIAHDIRNPLASIHSAIQIIAESPHMKGTEKSLAELARSESLRLTRMINDYLKVSPDSEQDFTPVNLVALLSSVVNHAASHPDRHRSIQLSLDYPADNIYVNGNESLLERATFNLVHNAIQASPVNGTVRVKLRTLDYTFGDTEAAAISISVSDEGAGIDDPTMQRLFESYFTTKSSGTGLGLAVVNRALRVHNGQVKVTSILSRTSPQKTGTTFTLYLPRSAEPEKLSTETL